MSNFSIRVIAALTLLSWAIAPPSAAQQPVPPATGAATEPSGYTLRVNTRLVVLDVQVQDNKGQPIHDLVRGDFTLLEDGKPQTLRNFEEHRHEPSTVVAEPRPSLPPGVFSNVDTSSPSETLNVFLLDELNTSVTDQTYAIHQLLEFSRHAPPGTRIAIFGLRSRLYLLSGFSTDLRSLANVLKHRVRPSASLLLDDANGTGNDPAKSSDLVSAATPPSPQPTADTLLAATLDQFDSDRESFQTQMRIQYTLDAFNEIAHYLGDFPGRKNLFWFSAAFPINLAPNPALPNGFAASQSNAEEFRDTIDLLNRAQVAIYPVDARGLATPPLYDAASSGRALARNPAAVSGLLNTYYSTQAVEHQTMDTIADDTGGYAIYNNNGLADAIAASLEAGANYYSLAYVPTDLSRPNEPRRLHVTLNSPLRARGFHLVYRQTYLATVADPTLTAAATADSKKYARLAITHGAPMPTDLLFKVAVQPASLDDEPQIASGNVSPPASKAHGPYRRFTVTFAALPSQIQMTSDTTGRRHGSIEFSAFLFDSEGNLLNTVGSKIDLNLAPDNYKRFLGDAVRFHMDVSVPTAGQSFLRLVVHDLSNDHFGVVEIPADTRSLYPN